MNSLIFSLIIIITGVKGRRTLEIPVLSNEEFDLNVECMKNISAAFFKQTKEIAVVNCASCARVLENAKYTIDSSLPIVFTNIKPKGYIIFSSGEQELRATLQNLTNSNLLNAKGNFLIIFGEVQKFAAQVLSDANIYKVLILSCEMKMNDIFKSAGACDEYKYIPPSFKGHSLKISWAKTVPFVINTKGGKNPGMAVSLFNTIAEKDGVRLKYNKPTRKYINEIRQTNTYSALQEDFKANKCDLYLGIASRTFQNDEFDITSSVLQERMVFIVPKPRQKSVLANLQNIVSANEWFAAMSTFLVSAIIVRLMAAEKKGATSFIYVASVFLVNNMGRTPKGDKLRIFLIFLYTYCFIQNMFMQGKLYSLSTKPSYEPPITNIDEVLESKLPLVFQESLGLIFLFYDDKHTMIFNTYTASNVTVEEDLLHFMERRDFITFVPESALLTNPEYENYYDKIDIFQYYMVFLMKKDHVLFERIDLRIKQVVQAGLIEKWISDLKWFYYVKNVKKLKVKHNLPFRLTVYHFVPAFFALGSGCFVAAVVFGLEVLTRAFMRCRSWMLRRKGARLSSRPR